LILAGCAAIQKQEAAQVTEIGYKSLKTSAILYQASIQAIAKLKDLGLLSESQVATVATLDQQFRRAYHTAVDAVILYERLRLTSADDDLQGRAAKIYAMVDDIRRIALNLSAYAKPLLNE